MEGVSTSTAGFIGLAEKGATSGTPEFITSFADYQRKFGGYLSENAFGAGRYLPYAVEQFFANGGARCFVMRVAPADAKAASVVMSSLTPSAKNVGKWGNNIRIAAATSSKAKSPVLAAEVDVTSSSTVYTLKNADGFSVGDTVVK